MTHGTNSCYQSGCDQPDCRRAHKIEVARWSSRVARTGFRRVPTEPTLNAVRYLRQAGITWREIATLAGCPQRSFDNISKAAYLNVNTRDRLHTAMRAAVAGLSERVADAEAAVIFADGSSHTAAVFPVEPMIEALDGLTARLDERDRRYLYRRHPLTVERVTRMCAAAGVDPEAVYGAAWYELEEAG